MGGSQSGKRYEGESKSTDQFPHPEKHESKTGIALGTLAPLRGKVLKTDFSTKIDLSVRCEQLPRTGSMFVMLYSKWAQDKFWTKYGITEVYSKDPTINPVFDRTFTVEFRVEWQRHLLFEVYRCRDVMAIEDLSVQKFVGNVEVLLVDVMMARNSGVGWMVRDLEYPVTGPNQVPPGRLAVFAEEDISTKNSVSWDMSARDIMSTDLWKRRADPYCIVHRTSTMDEEDNELQLTPIYRTEVCRRSNHPTWERLDFSVPQLCNSLEKQEIVIEVRDWFRVQSDRYIGECTLTFHDLNKAFLNLRPLVLPIYKQEGTRLAGLLNNIRRTKSKNSRSNSGTKSSAGSKERTRSKLGEERTRSKLGTKDTTASSKKSRKDTKSSRGSDLSRTTASSTGSNNSGSMGFGKVMGYLTLEQVGVQRQYSFLDFIRGGLDLRCVVAIDFSRSNGGMGDCALHSNTEAESAYTTVIRVVGEVMSSYDADDKYPVYGFGAKIPPSHTVCSDCFALTGDFFKPEVDGVEGIIRAYKRALHVVRLHGPTRISPTVQLVANIAKEFATEEYDPNADMKYFVLFLLTDGKIDENDELEMLNQIIQASSLPISVVVIGMGDDDFTFFKELADDVVDIHNTGDAGVDALAGSAQRDIVHFVAYNNYRDRPTELAAASLTELPREVVGYFSAKGVKPKGLDKMEDETGNPVGKVVPVLPGDIRKKSNSRKSTKLGGSSNMTSRASSKLSEDPFRKMEKDMLKKQLDELPEFIRNERERLIAEALSLGYDQKLIERTLKNGLPASDISALIDNMVHDGKNMYYRSMAYAALPDDDINLPGMVEEQPVVVLPPPAPRKPSARLEMLNRSRDASVSSYHSKEPSAFFPAPDIGGRQATKDALQAAAYELQNWGGHKSEGDSSPHMKGQHRKATKGREPSKSILINSRSNTKGLQGEGENRRGSRGFTVQFHHHPDEKPQSPHPARADSFGSGGHLQGALSAAVTAALNHQTSTGSFSSAANLTRESSAGLLGSQSATSSGGAHESSADITCRICFQEAVTTEFVPCGHRVACEKCATELGVTCPFCSATIVEIKRDRVLRASARADAG